MEYESKGKISMKHAKQLFPIALDRLLEIGEKGMKQREQRDRAKRGALPRKPGTCMHAMHEEKQAKQLQLKLTTTL